ncbi:hypothetical protein, partial [uncultured Dubosiella sp.]
WSSLIPGFIVLIGAWCLPLHNVFFRLFIGGIAFSCVYGIALIFNKEEIVMSVVGKYLSKKGG